MHPIIKELLSFKANDSTKEILSHWNKRIRKVCKPCWELKYCPYGPLVEEFPLPPPTLESASEHNEYLKNCLVTGKMGDGKKLDASRRKMFKQMIKEFDKNQYPDVIPSVVKDISCKVFGHICPVYYVAEPATETKEQRTFSRSIPRDVMLKVVRRDSQLCQKCFEIVPDDEVEFDHVIPYSKGGASSVANLRLVHRSCNRSRSNKTDDFLHEDPVGKLFDNLDKAKRKKRRARRK